MPKKIKHFILVRVDTASLIGGGKRTGDFGDPVTFPLVSPSGKENFEFANVIVLTLMFASSQRGCVRQFALWGRSGGANDLITVAALHSRQTVAPD